MTLSMLDSGRLNLFNIRQHFAAKRGLARQKRPIQDLVVDLGSVSEWFVRKIRCEIGLPVGDRLRGCVTSGKQNYQTEEQDKRKNNSVFHCSELLLRAKKNLRSRAQWAPSPKSESCAPQVFA